MRCLIVFLFCLLVDVSAAVYSVALRTEEDQQFVVAVGDVLALTPTASGMLSVPVSSGFLRAHVTEGRRLWIPFLFAGTFVADFAPDGSDTTSRISVTAVRVEMSPRAVQVGFTRRADFVVHPEGAPVTFIPNDPAYLEVTQIGTAGTLAQLLLRPLQRGSPAVFAVIQSPRGERVIGRARVDEFTEDSPARHGTVIDLERDQGMTKVIMRPLIRGLTVDFEMFASRSTFADGARAFTVTTDSFAPVLDETTGETNGEYLFTIEMPPSEDMYCFRYTFLQANSPPVPVGASGNINGHACKISVQQVSMCVDEEKPLVLQAVVTHDIRFPVVIVKKTQKPGRDAVFVDTGTATWGKQFDCSMYGPQEAPVRGGDHCEKYDVRVSETLFTERVQVTDEICMDLRVAGTWSPLEENDKSLNLSIATGTDLLGPNPAGVTVGAISGRAVGNGIEVVGIICPTVPANANGWRFMRDVATRTWVMRPGEPFPQVIGGDNPDPFGPPGSNDGPNDASQDLTPSPTKRIYDSDRPSLGQLEAVNVPVGTIYAYRLNAVEWIERNGLFDPECHPSMTWHSRITIKLTDQGWVRVGTNDIGPGHASLDFTAEEANAE